MLGLVRLAFLATGVVFLGACAGLFSTETELSPVDVRFQNAVDALERGDFVAARADLEELASRCESGSRGRSSVLLLSTLALDVRNPWQDPGRAADLASAYLRLPEAREEELALARTLYVLALDRGAELASSEDVASEPAESGPEVASRFSNCAGGGVVARVRVLPVHPGTPIATQLERATAERDSLERALRASRSRTAELEAELERIRQLLRGGGGGGESLDSQGP